MGFFAIDELRRKVAQAISPKQKSSEYALSKDSSEGRQLSKNAWYRLLQPDGVTWGFLHLCICGQEHRYRVGLTNTHEQTHKCACVEWLPSEKGLQPVNREHSLLRFLGLSASASADQKMSAYMSLPTWRHVNQPRRQPFIDTTPTDDGIFYAPSDPAKRE